MVVTTAFRQPRKQVPFGFSLYLLASNGSDGDTVPQTGPIVNAERALRSVSGCHTILESSAQDLRVSEEAKRFLNARAILCLASNVFARLAVLAQSESIRLHCRSYSRDIMLALEPANWIANDEEKSEFQDALRAFRQAFAEFRLLAEHAIDPEVRSRAQHFYEHLV